MQDLITQRLYHHQLLTTQPQSVCDLVKHLTCLQAQDFKQHLRAIASRTQLSGDAIEQAYNSGQIVRTRTQRGTIHCVAAQDAGWITQLCASKTLGSFTRRRVYLGISDTEIDDILATLPSILADGPLTRTTIAQQLKAKGFNLDDNKPYHIMCYAGTLGITVQGPLLPAASGKSKGTSKEHAFVLAASWIKNPRQLSGEEALAELTLRYFTSHGPATLEDFQRWSGLNKTQIKQAISLWGTQLQQQSVEGIVYYTTPAPLLPSTEPRVHFLAAFDEWLLGYKNRTATLDMDHHSLVDAARNGVFKPTLMIDGKTLGIRTTKEKKGYSEIHIKTFDQLDNKQLQLLQQAQIIYSKYLAKETRLVIL